jgi:hypothetical protein
MRRTRGSLPRTEADILYQRGSFWVFLSKGVGYQVMQDGITHATSVATFAATEDGLSLARAYAAYRGSTHGRQS